MNREWQRVNWVGGILLMVGAVATALQFLSDSSYAQSGYALTSVVGAGVGGSLLASGLAARLVSRQILGIDAAEAVEALRGTSYLYRSNQSLEITLTLQEDEIRVHAEHRFDLQGNFRRKRQVQFRMYTDVARWGTGGGFISIVEPSGSVLRAEELDRFVSEDAGKARFQNVYTFHPNTAESFISETYGLFRRSDRLFWTIEHISTDFQVRVNDYTGLKGSVYVKINHHREVEILENLKRRPSQGGSVMEFEFLGEVLPYQGFELQWKYVESDSAAG